jgi:hypothetical protein
MLHLYADPVMHTVYVYAGTVRHRHDNNTVSAIRQSAEHNRNAHHSLTLR